MLGGRAELTACLRAPEVPVVEAALRSIARLGLTETLPELTPLLAHEAPNVVVLCLECLVEICSREEFPHPEVLALLTHRDEVDVLQAACWALGKRESPAMADPLLRLLRESASGEVRGAAALAVGVLGTSAVAEALIENAARERDPAVSLTCRRALGQMPEAALSRAGATLLDSQDAFVRMEAAGILGSLGFADLERLLTDALEREADPAVQAALVEGLGHGGWVQAWPRLRALALGDPLVAYAAVNALADLLDADHLLDFAALLDTVETDTQREAILKRLALYGRSNGLPATVATHLVPLLVSASVNTAMLAFSAARWVDAPAIAGEVLCALEAHADGTVRATAAHAAVERVGGDYSRLIDAAGVDGLATVAEVVGLQEGLGHEPVRFCLRLAELAAQGSADAGEHLRKACEQAPAEAARAFPEALEPELEILLSVWQGLPLAVRSVATVDFGVLLDAANPGIRSGALDCLAAEQDLLWLARAGEMALQDEDPAVRHAARAAVRRLILC